MLTKPLHFRDEGLVDRDAVAIETETLSFCDQEKVPLNNSFQLVIAFGLFERRGLIDRGLL